MERFYVEAQELLTSGHRQYTANKVLAVRDKENDTLNFCMWI
jgi:hypothetical protein